VLSLTIPQPIINDLIAHARKLDPFECCGLLAGKDGTVAAQYRITNTVATDQKALEVFHEADVKQLEGFDSQTKAEVAYFMDPKEMFAAFKDMRQLGLDLLAIYHSHTGSPAYPSLTDIGLAYYPETAYLIISLQHKQKPDLQAYWIRDGVVSNTTFTIS